MFLADSGVANFQVILDAKLIREKNVNANLIIFGKPAVNMVTAVINTSLPKTYYEDECEIIELSLNPVGKVILIAGERLMDVKAAFTTI